MQKSYNQDFNVPPPGRTHGDFSTSWQCHQLDLLWSASAKMMNSLLNEICRCPQFWRIFCYIRKSMIFGFYDEIMYFIGMIKKVDTCNSLDFMHSGGPFCFLHRPKIRCMPGTFSTCPL